MVSKATMRRWLGKRAPWAVALGIGCSTAVWGQSPNRDPHRFVVNGSLNAVVDRDRQFEALAEEASFFERQNRLMRHVIQFAAPSVVHIEATKDAPSDGSFASSRNEVKKVEEAGAGVVIALNQQTYVLTNRHVVYPAKLSSIKIELADHSVARPTNVWSDPSTDIALLQLNAPGTVPAKIGNSESIEIGDSVLAIGSPFGLSHSVTYGIISAKGRRNLDLGSRSIEIQDFFQTDAAINPGNSGGPMMNLRGEVVGINTAIASNSGGSEGIGFAIPINMAMNVVNQLIEKGNMQRAYLGVQMDNQFDAAKAQRLGLERPVGALVKAIKRHSPAEQAGIQVGDVILEFDGARVESDGHLVQTVGMTPIGKTINMLIFRNGRTIDVSLRLVELPNLP